MEKWKYKFWFSKKDADQSSRNRTFAILKDGSVVEYTRTTDVNSNSCNGAPDDIKILGIGTFHHLEQGP